LSSFTDDLVVKYHPQTDKWIIQRSFDYHVGKYPSYVVIKIPKGFSTDLASVPRGFRWIIPKSGKYNQAAVLHDYMCVNFYKTHQIRCEIFMESMGVLKVPAIKKQLMYWAVRLGGPRNPRQ